MKITDLVTVSRQLKELNKLEETIKTIRKGQFMYIYMSSETNTPIIIRAYKKDRQERAGITDIVMEGLLEERRKIIEELTGKGMELEENMPIRCNSCNSYFFESDVVINKENGKDSCPECGAWGCLMDLDYDISKEEKKNDRQVQGYEVE